MSQEALGSFDEKLVTSLSSSLGEPGWLRETRLKAFRDFVALPTEKNPLYTKYVSSFKVDLSPFPLTPEKSAVD
ncbi:MAG TPA: hypothetical protein VKF39_01910, partial [Nitrososphaerales archaeon]|nr:hypothetical protein [Nitrososphaerales archaeon]